MILSSMLDRTPNTKLSDIAGLARAKDVLEEAIVLPLVVPDFFVGIREPWRGVLMFGPPGTGKTLLAKAIATEGNTTFFNVSASTLTSKYRGDSEKLVRTLFAVARQHAPSTIFIDEVDSLASQRGGASEHEASRRVKSELLTQMDGVATPAATGPDPGSAQSGGPDDGGPKSNRVIVLAATNFPWDLDEALRRRLEKRVYIPLPDREAREQMVRLMLRDIPVADDIDAAFIAEKTEGFSGADIGLVCRGAALNPIRKLRAKGADLGDPKLQEQARDLLVTMEDFNDALKRTRASVSADDVKRHEQFAKQFGST
jgi:katanin p60 ATPase-containing subunit A1|eukprot:gnl/Ergobibamus_cyprinoides/458.p2 GENE.gnl/Ergobibamus_cyprinoides/458~~gnl/Ergobibamus_cyprinoides/458.p2  ORF type:complete len:314 (+),score=88.70 gnl/Ergobibamus_cyprinoides/458:334-1275(+)